MKRTLPLMPLVLALSLALVYTQALASPALSFAAAGHAPGPQQPGWTPGPPPHTPGPPAWAQGGLSKKPAHFRGILTAVDANSLTVQLADGTSVLIALTPDSRIHVPGPKAQGDTLLVGMQVMVMAFGDETAGWTARSVMAIPGKPVRTHRVGIVSAYTAGVSITIDAKDGKSYTFVLTAETKILPAERAASLAVGSLVTIISPRDPASLGWTATGIVVHPPAT